MQSVRVASSNKQWSQCFCAHSVVTDTPWALRHMTDLHTLCLCVCRTAFTEPALCRTVGIAAVFAPGRGGRVGGQRLHYEDGRGCHGGTLFCRNASIFLHSIIIIVADVIVTIAISGSGWAAQTERQKMAKWENRDAGNQGVNMTCIISTFTDNWKHTVRLLCLMKSLWLCVWPRYGSGQLQKKAFRGWFIVP